MALKKKLFICLLLGVAFAAAFPERRHEGDEGDEGDEDEEFQEEMPSVIPEAEPPSDPEEDESISGRLKRNAVRNEAYRWTNATIPYVFDPAYPFGKSPKNKILTAMDMYANYTCLTFRPATPDDLNYFFYQNTGCSCALGMRQGKNYVKLGCKGVRLALHEIGHGLGLHHQHQRPDRDDWVTVLPENAKAGSAWRFDKYSTTKINTYDTLYDYLSVMQYGPADFAYNGSVLTLETKDPFYQIVISRPPYLSFRDIRIVNLMYSCNSHCPPQECPGEGFVGKDCQCWCPGDPVQPCGVANPVMHSWSVCKNKSPYCQSWANSGECERNPSYMLIRCRPACQICDPSCSDLDPNCDYYAHTGRCESDAENMQSTCPRSCRFCNVMIE